MEMKLELIAVPVSDVDAAIDFYVNKVGFNLDHDHTVNDELRFVQLTPKGSACSITIGKGIAADMEPGSLKGLQVVVEDTQAVHDYLTKQGVDVTDVQTLSWGIFVYFNDPDGNTWAVQQIIHPNS
jgi:catechol 2,3-dioxygenase-like lactoylglutathione lyase family enzyme